MHSEAQRQMLREDWIITRRHLQAARLLLPAGFVEDSEEGTVAAFEMFLAQNELSLALDNIAVVGEANSVASDFWRELAAAAENMNLHEEVSRCQRNEKSQR